jgi:hypothetical protein
LRAAQLSGISKEAKKYKFQWTKQIYKIVSISYRGSIKQIKVENTDKALKINKIQIVDPNKLFKIKDPSSEQLKSYDIDLFNFGRKENLKKLSESKKGIPLLSKVQKSKYNLRE